MGNFVKMKGKTLPVIECQIYDCFFPVLTSPQRNRTRSKMDSCFDARLSTQFYQRKNTLTQKRSEGWSQIFEQKIGLICFIQTVKTRPSLPSFSGLGLVGKAVFMSLPCNFTNLMKYKGAFPLSKRIYFRTYQVAFTVETFRKYFITAYQHKGVKSHEKMAFLQVLSC